MAQPSGSTTALKGKPLPQAPQRKNSQPVPPPAAEKAQAVAMPILEQSAPPPIVRPVEEGKAQAVAMPILEQSAPPPIVRPVEEGNLTQEEEAPTKRLESLNSMRRNLFESILFRSKSEEHHYEDYKNALRAYGDDPEVAVAYLRIADERKSVEHAAELFEEAKAIFKKNGDKEKVYELALKLSSWQYFETKWGVGIGGVSYTTKLGRPLACAEEALAMSLELYGPKHAKTAAVYDNFASIYLRLKQMGLVKKYEELAKAARRK